MVMDGVFCLCKFVLGAAATAAAAAASSSAPAGGTKLYVQI